MLWRACDAWLSERVAERGLKRSTVADYEDMFERLYRDLGPDTPVTDLVEGICAAISRGFARNGSWVSSGPASCSPRAGMSPRLRLFGSLLSRLIARRLRSRRSGRRCGWLRGSAGATSIVDAAATA